MIVKVMEKDIRYKEHMNDVNEAFEMYTFITMFGITPEEYRKISVEDRMIIKIIQAGYDKGSE